MRQVPSITSTRLNTMRFSSPMTTSRLRSPMSVSISTTFLSSFARPVPTFAVVVVLPTPPFPDVITITSPIVLIPPYNLISFHIFLLNGSRQIRPSSRKASFMPLSVFFPGSSEQRALTPAICIITGDISVAKTKAFSFS